MNILHKNNIGRGCYNKLLWYLALVALIFAISCKQSSNGSGQEHIISNEITITVEGDGGVIIDKLNTIRVKKKSSWKNINQKVIEKITLKQDKDIKEWRIKNAQGAVLKDKDIFEKDTIVFAVSKVKDEPPAKQIIITIEVDEGYTFKKTHKPCTVEAQKGSSWLSIKVKAEAKIELKQGYKQDSWKLGGKNGNRLEDAFVFNENAIIFATSIKEKISQYKVEHWKENIENDDYTKQEEDINTGIVGTNTLAEAKQYEGFKAQSFSQALIKEDGTTIIQIKYKRNITTLILDLSGGESSTLLEDGEGGKKLLKGKFEARVEVKGLAKENHRFDKWEPKLPVSFPATSTTTTYTAKWIPKNIVYRVNITGDDRVEVLSPNYIDIPLDTSKTIEEIRSEIEAKISLKAGWSAEDYGFYDFRIGGEDGEELLDSSQISQNVIVYARTNYKRFRMNGTNLEGYDGQKPRGRIFLPKETESIGNEAFKDCEDLISIDFFPCGKIKAIGENAFAGCTNLVNISLSSCTELTEIGRGVFSGCTRLKGVNLSICSELTSIGMWAFNECTNLENMDLSLCTKLKEIGASAFSDCSSLKGVNLSSCSELTSIGSGAFYKCTSLGSIDLSSCTKLTRTGGSAFAGCISLENIDLSSCTKLIEIGEYTFNSCSILKAVNLNGCSGLTSIGQGAFYECVGLENIDLSLCTNLKEIGGSAFYGCKSLENIDLSPCTNLNRIDGFVFYGCRSLKAVNLSGCSKITSIGQGTFYECVGLENIDLSSCTNLNRIGGSAFYGCRSLKTVNLSGCSELTSIGVGGFYKCKGLENMDLSTCTKLAKIEKLSFEGCLKVVVKLPLTTIKIERHAFGENPNYCKQVLVRNEEIKSRVIDSGYPQDRIVIY